MVKWIVVKKIQSSICLVDRGKPRKNPSQVGRHRDSNQGPPECESHALPRSHLARLKSSVTMNYLKYAYHAFFHSVLHYGLHIWGNGANINNIILKKKALSIISNSPLKPHCRPIFRSTILTVINQYIYDCLLHIKIDLNNYNFHFRHHNYPTRHNYFIVTPNFRLTKTKQWFNIIALHYY